MQVSSGLNPLGNFLAGRLRLVTNQLDASDNSDNMLKLYDLSRGRWLSLHSIIAGRHLFHLYTSTVRRVGKQIAQSSGSRCLFWHDRLAAAIAQNRIARLG